MKRSRASSGLGLEGDSAELVDDGLIFTASFNCAFTINQGLGWNVPKCVCVCRHLLCGLLVLTVNGKPDERVMLILWL